ncbi:hypothetical protein [Streptomyces acidicola]|uniref:hypothetical protein n=1 Tax=Streptomyces acidicola TaxID=2596892 RepID=UPI0037F3744A
MTVKSAVAAAVTAAHAKFGRLDVVVSNAGYGMFEEVTEQQLRDPARRSGRPSRTTQRASRSTIVGTGSRGGADSARGPGLLRVVGPWRGAVGRGVRLR